MAGIGFELKKLFRRKGLFASLRAYGYAGIICTGPMLLGVALYALLSGQQLPLTSYLSDIAMGIAGGGIAGAIFGSRG